VKVIATGVVLLVLVAAVVWLNLPARENPRGLLAQPAYFVNLADGELFPGESTDLAPIAVPGDPEAEGVRAHVFACGSCENDPFIAYVEKWTPEGKLAEERFQQMDV